MVIWYITPKHTESVYYCTNKYCIYLRRVEVDVSNGDVQDVRKCGFEVTDLGCGQVTDLCAESLEHNIW